MSSTSHMLREMPSRPGEKLANKESAEEMVATNSPKKPATFEVFDLARCLTPAKDRQDLIP